MFPINMKKLKKLKYHFIFIFLSLYILYCKFGHEYEKNN